jgi:hypothetical protein
VLTFVGAGGIIGMISRKGRLLMGVRAISCGSRTSLGECAPGMLRSAAGWAFCHSAGRAQGTGEPLVERRSDMSGSWQSLNS